MHGGRGGSHGDIPPRNCLGLALPGAHARNLHSQTPSISARGGAGGGAGGEGRAWVPSMAPPPRVCLPFATLRLRVVGGRHAVVGNVQTRTNYTLLHTCTHLNVVSWHAVVGHAGGGWLGGRAWRGRGVLR